MTTAAWWQIVRASSALEARLRELADEATEVLATELGADGKARLVAGIVVLTINTARREAIRAFEQGASTKKARAVFLALIDRGIAAARAV